jgi:hypothetical protein
MSTPFECHFKYKKKLLHQLIAFCVLSPSVSLLAATIRLKKGNQITLFVHRIFFLSLSTGEPLMMHPRTNAHMTSVSMTWIVLLVMSLAGVEAIGEEAAPVEQYNDSGETIRHAGVLIPTSVALKSLLSSSSDDAGEEDADVSKRASMSWNKLHGGWGKRERDWEFTDPEGAKNWNRLFGMVGKRAAKWNDLNGMWGKRGGDGQWNSLRGAWGKRAWTDMSHGFGKRGSPHWNNLRGMWGKK